jgi:signal transduction histidine kinase/CheY-like chemotaxis protein
MMRFGIEYYPPGVLRRTVYNLTGETTLGRGRLNTLRLFNSGVSRCHAKITQGDGCWVLQDLGSRNGSFVNGRRVSSQILSPGDRIRLGSALLRFVELGKDPSSAMELLAVTSSIEPEEPSFSAPGAEIRQQMGLVRTFLEAVKVGVSIVAPEMQVLYFNRTLDASVPTDLRPPIPVGVVLGCPEAGQKNCGHEACPGCPLSQCVSGSFESGNASGPREISWPPHGDPLWFLRFWVTPLPYFLMGDPLCLLTWEDATGQKMVEARFEELNRELEDTNRQLTTAIERANVLAFQAERASIAKSAFLARMSHEIRTPLNAVIGYTEMLLEGDLQEEHRGNLSIVHRSGHALLALIEDILDFSKIEAGEMRLESVDFPLTELVREACEIVRPRIQGRPVELWCRVNPVRTRQVILNLLSNAAKFTNKGEISVTVALLRKDEARIQLLFSVKDTGIGIPSNKLSIIFEPFRQAEDSTSRLHGGTGLGLTICKQLARLMEGEVWAESQEGVGSTFFFKAWFGRAAPQDLQGRVATAAQAEVVITPTAESAPRQEDGTPYPARILLVEDNAVNANLAKLMLTKAGHIVETAANGWEALKLFTASSKEYDMIFMDVEMPGMDGLQATRRIRSLGHLEVPIVAMTAHAMKEDMERCLACGMDDYLSKPIRKDLLLATVAKWTRRETP